MYSDQPSIEHLSEMLNRNPEQFLHYTYWLSVRNNELIDEINQLYPKIQHLEDQLAKNSSNSSKPPSTDGFKRQHKTKSMRTKSDKKPGAQHGHQGATLKMVDKPNEVFIHKLDACPVCHNTLEAVEPVRTEKRQVFDIPPLSVFITEHQAQVKVCPQCQSKNTALFPDKISNFTQYGTRIKAYASYLMNYQLLPFDRTAKLFNDLFNHKISTGTLANFKKEAFDNLLPFQNNVKKLLLKSNVINVDETGMRLFKKRYWFHVNSNSNLTYLMYHRKRGREAIDQMGILEKFQGTAMHDHFKPYLTYNNCKHAYCNAHHLRELTFMHEQYEHKWAEKMIKLLLQIKEVTDKESLSKKRLNGKLIKHFRKKYDQILKEGYQKTLHEFHMNPPPKYAQGKPKNLLDRLKIHSTEVLAFMYDLSIPFDNNQAERDIRMVKLQQKISGTFRSETGPAYFARIRSYISTAQKQKVNILVALEDAFLGKPFNPVLNKAE